MLRAISLNMFSFCKKFSAMQLTETLLSVAVNFKEYGPRLQCFPRLCLAMSMRRVFQPETLPAFCSIKPDRFRAAFKATGDTPTA